MDSKPAIDPLLWQQREDGVRLKLRVKPKARADEVTGVHGGALRVSVRAAPEDGRANEAVRRLLSRILGMPLAAVEITAGASSHDKTALLRGAGIEAVRAALARALGEQK